MDNISKLMDFYTDTLQKCGLFLLEENDSVIEYNIFEEFDIGIISFFHEENLKKLFLANFISKEIMKKSICLRKMVLELQQDNWTLEAIKSEQVWKEVMILTDQIREELKSRNSLN